MTLPALHCNCPDATYRQAANVSARSLSQQIGADWSQGFQGIKSQGGYCKHELATLITLGYGDELPNWKDYPTPPTPKYQPNYSPRLQNNPARGDDFSQGIGFN